VRPDPLFLLSPVAEAPGVGELGKGGPVMSVYVGIDVHRKRSQVAVIGQSGRCWRTGTCRTGWSRSWG
jgi:hypothetical protein